MRAIIFPRLAKKSGEPGICMIGEVGKGVYACAVREQVRRVRASGLGNLDGFCFETHGFGYGLADGRANGARQMAAFEPIVGNRFAITGTPIIAVPLGIFEHVGDVGCLCICCRVVRAWPFMPAAGEFSHHVDGHSLGDTAGASFSFCPGA